MWFWQYRSFVLRLANALERRIGFGIIASVRLSTDQDSGRSKVPNLFSLSLPLSVCLLFPAVISFCIKVCIHHVSAVIWDTTCVLWAMPYSSHMPFSRPFTHRILYFFIFYSPQGFAHVDFYTPEQAQKALISLEVTKYYYHRERQPLSPTEFVLDRIRWNTIGNVMSIGVPKDDLCLLLFLPYDTSSDSHLPFPALHCWLSKGVRVDGREIRVDMKKRVGEFEQAAAPRDW